MQRYRFPAKRDQLCAIFWNQFLVPLRRTLRP